MRIGIVCPYSLDVPGGVQATIRITAEVEGQDKPGCVVETLNRWLT